MNRRSRSMLMDTLRLRCDHAAAELKLSGEEASESERVEARASLDLEKYAIFRLEALRADCSGPLEAFDAAGRRSRSELEKKAAARDDAIADLREARARMRLSTRTLARAVALERAAARMLDCSRAGQGITK